MEIWTPPPRNANFAWVQHFIHHLSPTGIAAFVLANGSMSSNTSGEGEIRKNIIEADLVDCMVALPGQLFYNTGIPACLWFVARDKRNQKLRNRQGEVLFIDARDMGAMVDRTHRKLTKEDIQKIASIYHAWRGELGEYADTKGLCKVVKLAQIRDNEYILTPGRYVEAEETERGPESFEMIMSNLVERLDEQLKESAKLDLEIRRNLTTLGFFKSKRG